MVARPRTSGGSRSGLGQRESIGNPFNLTLGRRPSSTAATRRGFKGASARVMPAQPRPEAEEPATVKQPNALGFTAWFEERIIEYDAKSRPFNITRFRKCIITYYPEDASLGVQEPKIRNSGYMGGKYLKRSKCKHESGRSFTPGDFIVGQELNVYGQIFTIADADTTTRRNYRNIYGVTQSAAVEIPDDGFAQERALKGIPKPKHVKKEKKVDIMAGLPPGTHDVLRFFCAYQDDRTSGDADRRYVLHFFLRDNTVEVKEKKTDGVMPFPNLLNRSKLPKDTFFNPNTPLYDANQPKQVHWSDLRCGNTIMVWGRSMLLMSCDRTTELFYMRKGITQTPMQLEEDNGPKYPKTLPPYNGVGAENDLYSMGLSLQPKVIKSSTEEYKRWQMADNKVARYEMEFAHAGLSALDKQRRFVTNYDLGTGTIMVFEPPIPNSGLSAGVFLGRQRYKKYVPDQREGKGMKNHGSVLSRLLKPADFYDGAIVPFEHPTTGRLLQTFRVLGADGFTRRIEAEKKQSAGGHLQVVEQLLAERLCAARVQVREVLGANDSTGRGLPAEEFKAIMRELERQAQQGSHSVSENVLDDDVLDQICWQYCDPDEKGLVRYNDFVDALVLSAPMPNVPKMSACGVAGSAAVAAAGKNLEKQLIEALRMQVGNSNCNNGNMRQSFRREDTQRRGTVDEESWFRVLKKHKIFGVIDMADTRQLQMKYTEVSRITAGIEYERLCDKIYEGDFSDYMTKLLMTLPERGDLKAVDRDEYRAAHAGGNRIPTVVECLAKKTHAVRLCEVTGSDVPIDNQLTERLKLCLRSFASAFGRNHRKKKLRRNLMAYDTANAGSCTRVAFEKSVDAIIAAGWCDIDERDLELMYNYLFPRPWTRLNNNDLLDALCARDVKGVMRMHTQAEAQEEDPRFLFKGYGG